MRDSGEDTIDDSQLQPSPTKEKKNLKVLALVVVAVLIVAILASAYFVMVGKKNGEPKCADYPRLEATATSYTNATVVFWAFSEPPSPANLRIVLDSTTSEGTYFFPTNDDGVELEVQEGTDLADILYRDYADNGKVNAGDMLLISSLIPGDRYSLWVIWAPTNEPIACNEFSMPG